MFTHTMRALRLRKHVEERWRLALDYILQWSQNLLQVFNYTHLRALAALAYDACILDPS